MKIEIKKIESIYEIEKAKRTLDNTIEFNNNYKSNINNIKKIIEEKKGN